MTTNKQIIQKFLNNEIAKTENLFIENNVLYSYGYHYPLCLKMNNTFYINSVNYSNTTSKQRGLLIRELTYNLSFKELLEEKKINTNYDNIIIMDTEQIKELINTKRNKKDK